jgi:hypothetical protein
MSAADKSSRRVVQAPRFGKAKRRLNSAAQLAVDEAVKGIVADPLFGDAKTGALKGVRVVKFKVGTLQLLLAYQFDSRQNVVEVLDVAPHENFYRGLQKYLDGR